MRFAYFVVSSAPVLFIVVELIQSKRPSCCSLFVPLPKHVQVRLWDTQVAGMDDLRRVELVQSPPSGVYNHSVHVSLLSNPNVSAFKVRIGSLGSYVLQILRLRAEDR
jgi:hypothetical protein